MSADVVVIGGGYTGLWTAWQLRARGASVVLAIRCCGRLDTFGVLLAFRRGQARPRDASMAKYWASETAKEVIDGCLQLHGGYGYMKEYPVAKAYLDTRVQTIYGGTSEIMKEIIGRVVLG